MKLTIYTHSLTSQPVQVPKKHYYAQTDEETDCA